MEQLLWWIAETILENDSNYNFLIICIICVTRSQEKPRFYDSGSSIQKNNSGSFRRNVRVTIVRDDRPKNRRGVGEDASLEPSTEGSCSRERGHIASSNLEMNYVMTILILHIL
jgi:hypothetical protein